MGRWKLIEDFGKVVDTGITNIYCESNPSAEVAKMIHNAECDAYEQRIAELTTELARVKAESLRVVKDGKQDCVYCGGTDIECIHCYGYCKPVRLERWDRPC